MVLGAAPADGARREDWDLLSCVETESRAAPGGTKPSADKQAGSLGQDGTHPENSLLGTAVRTKVWTCLLACGFGPHSKAGGWQWEWVMGRGKC